jgi:hypothetical protein
LEYTSDERVMKSVVRVEEMALLALLRDFDE